MSDIKILWADDEIDLLKPQLYFLNKKGYEVVTTTNGYDAISILEEPNDVDIVFLDESMPGITGLETLERIKAIKPNIPVVMITKNEAENLMEEAIGAQIDDYLIKPVNPIQILLTLKKIIDNKRLVSEKTVTDYQQDFRKILMEINEAPDYQSWINIYNRIISWELKLDKSSTREMEDIISMQKTEANQEFSKFVERNYHDWADVNGSNSMVMSHNVMREKIFTQMDYDVPTVVLLLDNLRYDQWKVLQPIITEVYRIESEDFFCSILPTSTQYSRNAIFAGMPPADIAKKYPKWWLDDFEKGGKNNHEGELVTEQIKRTFRKEIKHDYVKITTVAKAKELDDNIYNYMDNDITFIVYNFIDMLSHARTEMEILKELAGDEKAYRSLTRSWFLHSPIWSALKKMAERKVQLFILTDHGTIRVQNPSKVIGDRNTTTNLRYKMGRNLQFEAKDVLLVEKPENVGLPRPNISSKFIFAKENKYFLYPNNYNHYNSYFKNTFQHGGISLEEMICPVIKLSSK